MKVFVAMTVVALTLALTPPRAGGAPAGPARSRVVQFLKAHVIGKTLETGYTGRVADGKVEAVYEVRRTFSNLVETREGFTFDVLVVTRQVNHDLNDRGKRTGKSYNKNRTSVTRYLVGEKLSTGALIGTEVDVFSDDPDAYPYTPMVVRMDAVGDTLFMEVKTVLYQDFYGKGDRFTPGAVDTRFDFVETGGKLTARESSRAYNVDPKTLERTLQSEPRPVRTHRQVD